MIKAIAQEILGLRLLRSDDAVTVGVSGGADSIALVHLLLSLNREHDWKLRLHVAHLNHLLRAVESEKDAAFVQAVTDDLNLPCTIESVDVTARAAASGFGIEEEARRQRYLFFERVCRREGMKIVAVGHHADDQAETILHRVFRGTGLRGLAGIPRSRPIQPGSDVLVVRPLLSFTRKELRDYLDDAGVAFREDRSNQSAEPMRNRIRNQILPMLEADVNPQVRDALLRLSEQAGWLQEFLFETVERTFDTLVVSRNDQVLVLNAESLGRKSRIVQTEIIRVAYRCFGLGEQDLAFANLLQVLDIISEPAGGRQAQLPGGMSVVKRYGQLLFSLPSTESRETIAEEVAVRITGVTTLPIRGLEIECRVEEVSPAELAGLRRMGRRMEERMDLEAVRPPLTLRKRRPGDRFTPLGAPGSKKVSDFLADARVFPDDREEIALLCDGLGPIWIIGHRIDDRVKLTPLTRQVLHVCARLLPRS